MKAVWNGTVIAESEDTVVVEGNHYFPASSAHEKYLESSETTSVCSWKGTAHYFSIVVDGEKNADAVWTYREPKPEAVEIAGHLAFWRGVEVVE